jgi:hypothetical protein
MYIMYFNNIIISLILCILCMIRFNHLNPTRPITITIHSIAYGKRNIFFFNLIHGDLKKEKEIAFSASSSCSSAGARKQRLITGIWLCMQQQCGPGTPAPVDYIPDIFHIEHPVRTGICCILSPEKRI